MDKLRKVFPDCEVMDMDDIHYEQRIMKSPAEVELMTKNWEMVSEVFKNVIPKIKAGMTEREVEGMFVAEMGRLGAESFVQAFAPMIASGPVNSFVSMRRNDERKIEESEMISIACGTCYGGYNGMICTPLVLGEIPQKIKDAVYYKR